MAYDNSCHICRGRGIRTNGQTCTVCDGRGYMEPMGSFSFFKMLFYLAGLVAICGLCGYCAFGRGDRWWAPKASGVSFETTTDPGPFQRLYDRLVEARKNNQVGRLVSKIDSAVFEIWSREQCTESVGFGEDDGHPTWFTPC